MSNERSVVPPRPTEPMVDDGNAEEVYQSSVVCRYCRHFDPSRRNCSAFPNGIPVKIWFGLSDHRSPVDGDHGIMFAPIEPDDEKIVDGLRDRIKQGQDGNPIPLPIRGKVTL